ncbi:MAG: hypothetical protein ABIO50_00185 [Nitrosospira sp.]
MRKVVGRLNGNAKNSNSFRSTASWIAEKIVATAELPAVRIHISGIADGLAG